MELELVDKSEYDKDNKSTEEKKEAEPYDGPERRVAERRCGHDRRQEVRFQLEKPERRSGKDRRRAKSGWDKDKHYLF